jgi:hypothetical protein
MERDKLLDHLDGVIRGLGGDAALAAVEGPGNTLERYVVAACPNSQAYDPCRISVLSDPKVVSLRAEGFDALSATLGSLEQAERDLVLAAGKLRLTAQATLEPAASLVGPPTSVVLDYRLDDGALASLMSAPRTSFADAVKGHLVLASIDRGGSEAEIAQTKSYVAKKYQAKVDAMAAIFEERAKRYQSYLEVEHMRVASHPELGEMGSRGVEIRFDLANGGVDYAKASLQSLPQARAAVATKLFDDLVAAAKWSGSPNPEQTVAYALLALADKPRVDLRLNIDMQMADTLLQSLEHYREAGYADLDQYARGTAVSPIDGGMFNLDDLVNLQK